jgi:hypothetical protein
MEAGFLGSAEYLADNGGTSARFLQALYPMVLNRSLAPTEAPSWSGLLNQGVPRSTVAFDVLTSQESCTDLVQSWYTTLLGRSADSSGLNGFVQAMLRGMRQQQVIGLLVESDEYFAKA